ncbi:hypothetical protein KY285_014509 [Solanum tuberosum]|nr:hypothetical protein KY289_014774 [Solanum tuberosum]KAH0700260.1 hypothetical protein KY284_014475 [Solanum tuberosum]KAH0718478.1 hypothetical protein KY285_014509 [Solanum tuberosum]
MELEVGKGQNESANAAVTPLVTTCGWKRSIDGRFMSNLKDFVNTPMADHKVCFKNTIDEKVENFRKQVHRLKRWGKFCDHPMAARRGESLEIRSDMTHAYAAFDQFY